jgi:hypothetical protein
MAPLMDSGYMAPLMGSGYMAPLMGSGYMAPLILNLRIRWRVEKRCII